MLRVALVGVGQVAAQSHIPAVLAASNAELVALIDLNLQRCRELAAEIPGGVAVFSGVDEVNIPIDAVIIATPNHTHRDIALQCAKKGWHQLIEKPLANTVEEGKEIVQAAVTNNVLVRVGYCMRFRDTFVRLKELIQQGFFEPKTFLVQFGTPGGWATLSDYTMSKKNSGGGVLVVSGTHFIDLILDLFGRVSAVQYCDDSEGGNEANARAKIQFESGIKGAFQLSKTCGMENGFVLECKDHWVILPESDTGTIFYTGKHDDVVSQINCTKGEKTNVFLAQVEDFASACQGGQSLGATGEQGLVSLEFIQECYEHRQYAEFDRFGV